MSRRPIAILCLTCLGVCNIYPSSRLIHSRASSSPRSATQSSQVRDEAIKMAGFSQSHLTGRDGGGGRRTRLQASTRLHMMMVVVVVVARNSSEGAEHPVDWPFPYMHAATVPNLVAGSGLCPSREDAALGTCGGVPGEPCGRASPSSPLAGVICACRSRGAGRWILDGSRRGESPRP